MSLHRIAYLCQLRIFRKIEISLNFIFFDATKARALCSFDYATYLYEKISSKTRYSSGANSVYNKNGLKALSKYCRLLFSSIFPLVGFALVAREEDYRWKAPRSCVLCWIVDTSLHANCGQIVIADKIR